MVKPREQVTTVGGLKELLAHSDDNESLTCYLEYKPWWRRKPVRIEICPENASSTAGGRATILWFGKRIWPPKFTK